MNYADLKYHANCAPKLVHDALLNVGAWCTAPKLVHGALHQNQNFARFDKLCWFNTNNFYKWVSVRLKAI